MGLFRLIFCSLVFLYILYILTYRACEYVDKYTVLLHNYATRPNCGILQDALRFWGTESLALFMWSV